MTTKQTETAHLHKIRWQGQNYLLSHEDLSLVFEVYGKPGLPCEMAGCEHVELVPIDLPEGISDKVKECVKAFKQKCIYEPDRDLEWEVSNTKTGELRSAWRCFELDKKLKEHLASGYLNEFRQ